MIFVKGYGQMCNNWLQYAHLYVWGLENNVRVVSMRFSYKYKYFKISERRDHNTLTYLLAKLLIKTRLMKCLLPHSREDALKDDVISALRNTPLIAFDGWAFRQPELMIKHSNDLRRLFAFRENTVAAKRAWLDTLPEAEITLGVHIRRGDYATWLGGIAYFEDDVYAGMISRFKALHTGKSIRVLIATNDRKTDIELIRRISGVNDVFVSDGNPGEDLFVLSQCDYIIGPRSSFSLVASFYNDVPIHWIENRDDSITEDCFKHFNDLFMII